MKRTLLAIAAVGLLAALTASAEAAYPPAGLPFGASVSQIQHYQALGFHQPWGQPQFGHSVHRHRAAFPGGHVGHPGFVPPGHFGYRPVPAHPGFGHAVCRPQPPPCVQPVVPPCGFVQPVPRSSFSIGGPNFFLQFSR